MAATDDIHEALFLMFQAIYTADNAAGGLSNSSGNQYVQAFIREWEQQAIGSPPIPRIVFSVVDDFDQSPYGGDSNNCRIRMYLETIRDSGNIRESTALTRMRTVYRGADLGTQGGYSGGRVAWWRSPRVPSSIPNINRRAVECTCKLTA